MRIRERLDVTVPLKRRKNIQIGKEKTVYARFQYEKLSLFYFICGKSGHGESFCPLQLRIEPTNISFGWDLSLRAELWRCGKADSRWLRQSDGSLWSKPEKEGSNQSNKWLSDLGNANRRESWQQYSNPNLIPLNPSQQFVNYESDSRRNLGSSVIQSNNSDSGPLDLMLEEENELLLNMKGKKRQRLVEDSTIVGDVRHSDVTVSSGVQSSRLQ